MPHDTQKFFCFLSNIHKAILGIMILEVLLFINEEQSNSIETGKRFTMIFLLAETKQPGTEN